MKPFESRKAAYAWCAANAQNRHVVVSVLEKELVAMEWLPECKPANRLSYFCHL